MDLVDHQKEHLKVLELDGLELTDDSMEKISTCPRLMKLSVSFAELLTGKSLRFIRVMNIHLFGINPNGRYNSDFSRHFLYLLSICILRGS